MKAKKTLTLEEIANALLAKSGFGSDGTPKKRKSRAQSFFERRTIISTPMGNGIR